MDKHLALTAVVAAAFTVALAACSKCSPDGSRPGAQNGGAGEEDDAGGESLAPVIVPGDGGARRPSRSAEPQAEQGWLDGGVDPACTGPSIDLAAVLADKRCATNAATAKALRAAIEADAKLAGTLKQEAKRGADGRLELVLVNRGPAAVTLPLSFHPKIPAFVVLADNANESALFELETPRLDVAHAEDADAGGARFARIVLPPSGKATARIAIDPKVVRRVDRKVVDGGAPPAPARLAPGKWTLHVGQLVTDVETGEPATIAWEIAP